MQFFSAKTIAIIFANIALGCIVFLYPIPNSHQLRTILWIAVGLILLFFSRRLAHSKLRSSLKLETDYVLLILLTLWMIIRAISVSSARNPLGNLVEEWLIGVVLLGLLSYRVAKWTNVEQLENLTLRVSFLALIANLGWLFGYWVYLASSGLPILGATPVAGRDFFSTVAMLVFAIYWADYVARTKFRTALFNWPIWVMNSIGLASVGATILLNTRNGVVVVIGLILLTFYPLKRSVNQPARAQRLSDRRTWATPAQLATLICVVLLASSLAIDARWVKLYTVITNGFSEPVITTVNSIVIRDDLEGSAYERLAHLRLSLPMIAENPFGLGYGQGAYGEALEKSHQTYGLVSSHSGIVDFTLANGIPGLFLLLAFIFFTLKKFLKELSAGYQNRLIPMFLLIVFVERGLLDGHMNGWRLKLFAILFAISIYQPRKTRPQD